MEKNKKLTVQDLIEIVSFKQKINREEADLFVRTLFSIVQEQLSEDGSIKIKDFGTFKLTLIQARESIDINTGEKIEIPAHHRFSFLPATALKELVNKPFSNFETTLLSNDFHDDNIQIMSDEEHDEHDVVFVIERKPSKKNGIIQYEVGHKAETPTVMTEIVKIDTDEANTAAEATIIEAAAEENIVERTETIAETQPHTPERLTEETSKGEKNSRMVEKSSVSLVRVLGIVAVSAIVVALGFLFRKK